MVVGGLRTLLRTGGRATTRNLDDVGASAGRSDSIRRISQRGDDLTNRPPTNTFSTTQSPSVRRFSFRNTAIAGGGGFLLGSTAGENTLGNAIGNPFGFVEDIGDNIRGVTEGFSETTGNLLEGAGNVLLLAGLGIGGFLVIRSVSGRRRRRRSR